MHRVRPVRFPVAAPVPDFFFFPFFFNFFFSPLLRIFPPSHCWLTSLPPPFLRILQATGHAGSKLSGLIFTLFVHLFTLYSRILRVITGPTISQFPLLPRPRLSSSLYSSQHTHIQTVTGLLSYTVISRSGPYPYYRRLHPS